MKQTVCNCWLVYKPLFSKFIPQTGAGRMDLALFISTSPVPRAKNFHSSARPRQVLSCLGRVDFQKHLSYGTSRVCLKKDVLFYWGLSSHAFWTLYTSLSFAKFNFFSRQLSRFCFCFPRNIWFCYFDEDWDPHTIYGNDDLVWDRVNDAITVVASFVIIKEVIKPVKKYEESRIQKFHPTWRKEFPWVKIDAEKNEMFCIVCRRYPTVADKASRLYVGINGSSATDFHRDSLVSHEKSHSHYFRFQRAQSEEKPERRKIDEESKESS